MKYNTTATKQTATKQSIINLFFNYKPILKLLSKFINWEAPFSLYKIKNGFTFNELNKALKLDIEAYNTIFLTKIKWDDEHHNKEKICLNKNIYINKTKYNETTQKEEGFIIDDFTTSNYTSYYNPSLESARKQKEYIFYLIFQDPKYFIKREQYKPNYNIDRFKNTCEDYAYLINIFNNKRISNEFINYIKHTKPSDRPGYVQTWTTREYIKTDKSGYFNEHINELKQRAQQIRTEKAKNEVLTHDFTSVIMNANKIKNDLIIEFKNIASKCVTEADFKCLKNLCDYVQNKIYYINKIINKINNKIYVNMESINKDIEADFKYNLQSEINRSKKYYFYDFIENDIKTKMKQYKKTDYFYYSLSWTDKRLKIENDILYFNETLEGFIFDYKINLNDKKIYSFE